MGRRGCVILNRKNKTLLIKNINRALHTPASAKGPPHPLSAFPLACTQRGVCASQSNGFLAILNLPVILAGWFPAWNSFFITDSLHQSLGDLNHHLFIPGRIKFHPVNISQAVVYSICKSDNSFESFRIVCIEIRV